MLKCLTFGFTPFINRMAYALGNARRILPISEQQRKIEV